jgi:hypothetical protein
MNAGKLFGIIIILMLLLLVFGIIIKTCFSMLADVSKTWLILLYKKYCKLVKANWLMFGASNEPN